MEDPLIIRFMPSQLELINGRKLLETLEELAKKSLEGQFLAERQICGTRTKRSAAPLARRRA